MPKSEFGGKLCFFRDFDLIDWLIGCVTGGPAVGDIRSRCLRLSDQSTAEALAVRNLLGYRLPLDPLKAKSEWYLYA